MRCMLHAPGARPYYLPPRQGSLRCASGYKYTARIQYGHSQTPRQYATLVPEHTSTGDPIMQHPSEEFNSVPASSAQESHNALETYKRLAAEAATQLVQPGMVIGIGSSTTAAFMLHALAHRIQDGLHIIGAVPTSKATEELARSLAIPLTDLDTHPELDLAIDGADEIDNHLNLIKGGGGALLREKIVASAARRFLIIADITKHVTQLGLKAALPIEVIPFAATPVAHRL